MKHHLGSLRLYDESANTPSDIWEHVPILYMYAATASHVTEFGTSRGNSTAAFLLARPNSIRAYDVVKNPRVSRIENAAKDAGVDFKFIKHDILELTDIEETDILFIDSLHVHDQMKHELGFSHRVMKHIIMHDTDAFGVRGERKGFGGGIWPAVGDFIRRDPKWQIGQIIRSNNGLVILNRISGEA